MQYQNNHNSSFRIPLVIDETQVINHNLGYRIWPSLAQHYDLLPGLRSITKGTKRTYISNESFFLGLLLMFVFVLNFWIYHFNYLILTYISTYYYIIIFFGYFLQRRVFFMTHLQFPLTQMQENIIL